MRCCNVPRYWDPNDYPDASYELIEGSPGAQILSARSGEKEIAPPPNLWFKLSLPDTATVRYGKFRLQIDG